MSIGATAENQALLLMVTIIGFIAIPVLLAALWLIVGLIGRLFRIPSGVFPILTILAVPVALLAISLQIDAAAKPLTAQVIEKQQLIKINREGYWNNDLKLTVRYAPDGTPLPPFSTNTTTYLAGSSFEVAVLWPSAEFDQVRPGDSIAIRALPVRDGISLIRLASQSTATLLPWTLIGGAGALLVVVAIVWRLRRTPLGAALLTVLFLAALTYPLANAYQSWKQHDNLSGATQRLTATVQEATRITEVSIGTDRERSYYTVPQPYEIVQFAMEVPGFRDPIIGVDAVDISGGARSRFGIGTSVDVVYAPDNPREARIVNQTRTHYFQTTFGIYRDDVIYILAFAALTALGAGLKQLIFRA